jgi:hypothetical protein
MPRIEQNNLIANMGLYPERINLIRYFYSQFDCLPVGGGNRHIANVEPLFFQGLIAGTEFLTYAATKLYICLSINFGYTVTVTAAGNNVVYYNEANANFHYANKNAAFWDAGAAAQRFLAMSYTDYNLYFSRFIVTVYTSILFNGYRITLD